MELKYCFKFCIISFGNVSFKTGVRSLIKNPQFHLRVFLKSISIKHLIATHLLGPRTNKQWLVIDCFLSLPNQDWSLGHFP